MIWFIPFWGQGFLNVKRGWRALTAAASAQRPLAAAPRNTTDSRLETLCIGLVLFVSLAFMYAQSYPKNLHMCIFFLHLISSWIYSSSVPIRGGYDFGSPTGSQPELCLWWVSSMGWVESSSEEWVLYSVSFLQSPFFFLSLVGHIFASWSGAT
jgi:hypothetical protein